MISFSKIRYALLRTRIPSLNAQEYTCTEFHFLIIFIIKWLAIIIIDDIDMNWLKKLRDLASPFNSSKSCNKTVQLLHFFCRCIWIFRILKILKPSTLTIWKKPLGGKHAGAALPWTSDPYINSLVSSSAISFRGIISLL